MPVTLKLTHTVDADNPVLGDLHLDKGSYVVIGDTAATFPEAVAQAIRSRLQFFKNEWFLDKQEGTPWYQAILVKSPDLRAIKSLFRKIIQDTPGVAEVGVLDVSLDRSTRELDVTFKCNLTDSQVLDSRNFAPFIVK